MLSGLNGRRRGIEGQGFVTFVHNPLFIFLTLSCYAPHARGNQPPKEQVDTKEDLLKRNYTIVHGDEMSGKTALGRFLFLFLTKELEPVLHIDLQHLPRHPLREGTFRHTYNRQFNGDYSLWKRQSPKTLILDNLKPTPYLIDFIVFSKKHFDRIIVTLSSDIFNAFFRDEERLAEFYEMEIEPLTHRQQETLIRNRLRLSDRSEPITDGVVDQIENRVNSIIISNKIVPRYPFYVLSILQTYEAFMPREISITSYGHCYYVLIIANLVKAGIPRSDDQLNTCFHFAERLAFEIYQVAKKSNSRSLDFDKFVAEYKTQYIISQSILSRLMHPDFGIINTEGQFKTVYMHHFFLGRFLSKNRSTHISIIEDMCENSHVTSNHLTLLFVIHHTDDGQIIDDILLRTMCALDTVQPAILDRTETRRFKDIIAGLPKNILSDDSVEKERRRQRDTRDLTEKQDGYDGDTDGIDEQSLVNDIYKIFKNNEILGQILRTKYGTLKKATIVEIIETIADSGLRLVNVVLKDEKEIADTAHYLHAKYPKDDIEKIRNYLQFFSFLWTIVNVEKVARAINVPEVIGTIDSVVKRKGSPAYDLIGYFSLLDSSPEISNDIKKRLSYLLKNHKDLFIKWVLSIRTQFYMNTHDSGASMEQSVCSLLDIKYSSTRRSLRR